MIITPYIKEFEQNCLAIFESNCPSYFLESEREEFTNWLEEIVGNKHNYWVGLVREKPIACGGIYIADDSFGRAEYPNEVGFAWGMVHSDYQKQGYGKQLAEYRIHYLKQEYPERPIILRTTQKTYQFFERFDFSIREWIKQGYGDRFDKVIMEYRPQGFRA